MTTVPAASLTTHHLTVGYRQQRGPDLALLTDLNLVLSPGKMVCFMGPNGSGKSSLIRTLAGIQKPLAGKVSIAREAETAMQVAVVLTDRISAMDITVSELVSFGRYPYLKWNIALSREDRRAVANALDMVHIGHLAAIPLHQLSDGQIQMAMIARALAQQTPIILLDEPTAHLDLNNRLEVMKLLRKLARDTQRAILVSTHELDLALQLADLIWLAGKEKRIISGMPEDLVLQGEFDAIFELKGFDLKTGKVQHDVTKQLTLQVVGSGPELLWTKNALQRNGYAVSDAPQRFTVSVQSTGDALRWKLVTGDGTREFRSVHELISSL